MTFLQLSSKHLYKIENKKEKNLDKQNKNYFTFACYSVEEYLLMIFGCFV